MEGEADDVAGSLLAGLVAEGEYIDEGRFSLDPEQALVKLRGYQLADPHAYLTLVIEAAQLAGGDRARVEIETGTDTHVRFAGAALSEAELRGLLATVFADLEGLEPATRARTQMLSLLGLALNGALALEPQELRIENVDAKGVRQVARYDGSGRLVELERSAAAPGAAGHTEFVFDGNPLDLLRPGREHALVIERCAASRLHVELDGARISHGPIAALTALGAPSPRTSAVRLDGLYLGQSAHTQHEQAAHALIHTRGVLAERLEIEGPPGFMAVVETDLRKDLSQAMIARGPELDAVLQAIDEARRKLPEPSPTELPRAPASTGAEDTQATLFAAVIVGVLILAGVLIALL